MEASGCFEIELARTRNVVTAVAESDHDVVRDLVRRLHKDEVIARTLCAGRAGEWPGRIGRIDIRNGVALDVHH